MIAIFTLLDVVCFEFDGNALEILRAPCVNIQYTCRLNMSAAGTLCTTMASLWTTSFKRSLTLELSLEFTCITKIIFSCFLVLILAAISTMRFRMQLFFMVANHQTINDMFAMYRWKSNRDDPYTVSLNRTIFLSNAVINHGWWQGFARAQQDFLVIPYNGSERLLLWSWQLQPVIPAGR